MLCDGQRKKRERVTCRAISLLLRIFRLLREATFAWETLIPNDNAKFGDGTRIEVHKYKD